MLLLNDDSTLVWSNGPLHLVMSSTRLRVLVSCRCCCWLAYSFYFKVYLIIPPPLFIVKQDGISFHPTEYALLTKEAQPECPYASKVYRSDEPTHDQHFKLNSTAMDKSNADRQQLFQELLKKNDANARRSMSPPTKMGRPGVVGPNGPLQGRPRPPPPTGMFRRYPNASQQPPSSMAPKPAAKSLFIPSRARKPSLGSASNFTKMPQGMPNRPPLPSPSADSTPKGFLRQSRVQMIDFNENTSLEKSNAEEINAAKERKCAWKRKYEG